MGKMSSIITRNIISIKTANIYDNNDVVISIKYNEIIDDVIHEKECFIKNIGNNFVSLSDIRKNSLEGFIHEFSESQDVYNRLIKDLYFNNITFNEILSENIID